MSKTALKIIGSVFYFLYLNNQNHQYSTLLLNNLLHNTAVLYIAFCHRKFLLNIHSYTFKI